MVADNNLPPVGIELGGIFTDAGVVHGNRIEVAKNPSAPYSPDIGTYAALGAAGIPVAEVSDLVSGCTVATNARLERKGVRVAVGGGAGYERPGGWSAEERRNGRVEGYGTVGE